MEYALVSVAVLLSPGGGLAGNLASLADQALNIPDWVRDRYPNWLDLPEQSGLEFGRTAVLTGLAGGIWGLDPFLAWFDWRESPEDIEDRLRRIPSRPVMSWTKSPDSAEGPTQYPSDTSAYLREIARQSREAGMALVSITKGDSYALCFVPLNRTDLLLADAKTAGFTHENDCGLELIDP
ncbi:hypothetical protein [Nocardia sp. NPDC051981]|uniref:DUF6630 family protein n=1 Tax=Nocardia sp. NPDC051981 TaxID=3155417 RepID=UPI003432BCFC